VKVVALVADLMDRSHISAASSDVVFTGDPDACAGADMVVVDLARYGEAVPALRAAAPGVRIVAFGPHVDGELLARARTEGADVVLPRSQFFRDPAAALSFAN
jgi:hypothetical protein